MKRSLAVPKCATLLVPPSGAHAAAVARVTLKTNEDVEDADTRPEVSERVLWRGALDASRWSIGERAQDSICSRDGMRWSEMRE